MNSKGCWRERQLASSADLAALSEEELRSIEGGGIVQPSLVLIGGIGGPCIFGYIEGYAFPDLAR